MIQSATLAFSSLALALIVFRLARGGFLSFRYAIGWLGLLLLGPLFSLLLRLTQPLSSLLAVTPGVIVSGLGVLILLVICIQLSISISGLQNQVRRLAEEGTLGQLGQPTRSDFTRVLVIVPAFNEERSIGSVVGELLASKFDVLVVDDGSTDRTRQRALASGAVVASLPYNTGVGGALRTGLLYATINNYQTVVQCDGDGQHPISHINDLVAALEAGDSDMVIGSRFANGQAERMRLSPLRRLAMWTLASSASRATGTRITDVTSGFRAWRGQIVFALADHLPAYYLGDTYEAVIAAGRAGYRVTEIPAPISERLYGTSSASPLQAARLTTRAFAASVLRLHVRLPSRQ